MNRFFDALGRVVVRLRWIVVFIWIVGALLAVHSLPSLGSQVNNNNGAFLPASAPSNQADLLAQPLSGAAKLTRVPIVAVTSNVSFDAADRSALSALLVRLRAVPSVTSAHYLYTSPNSRAAELIIVSSVPNQDEGSAAIFVDQLNSAVEAFQRGDSLSYGFAEVVKNLHNI